MAEPILWGHGDRPVVLLPQMANRHGLIAGATGTGKTMTLRRLIESFSAQGVPVFVTDVKGDLGGLSFPGTPNERLTERLAVLKMQDFAFHGYPVTDWDVFGEQGIPIRTTLGEMGPLLLGRLLDLNATQQGILNIAFQIADDQGALLLDLNDLKALLQYLQANAKDLAQPYGNLPSASLATILRQVVSLQAEAGDRFFAEPALALDDLLQPTPHGEGMIHRLVADRLMQQPRLYAAILLWLLSELFESLPEVGDPDKPRLVLCFDEAHLLFDDMPEVLLDKIAQVMLLIRSKGVGVYFITQNPKDIPETILGQLGNRVLHAIRVFSPRDQKAVRAMAEGFRANPNLDLEAVIPALGIGEAVASTLDANGMPTVVERIRVVPAQSRSGPATPEECQARTTASPLWARYAQPVDRESAYEILTKRLATPETVSVGSPKTPPSRSSASRTQDPLQAFVKSTLRAIGNELGRELMRGLLGSRPRRR